MQSKRTHEHQLDVIQKRVETANAGPKFNERTDLDRPAGQPLPERQDGPVPPVSAGDERRMPRGVHQQSDHNKPRVQPDKGDKP